MLTVSDQAFAAVSADFDRRRPARFAEWWQAHADVLGPRDPFACARMLDELADEIALTGFEREPQQFLFCAARARMPDMGNEQYLATCDVIVGEGSDREKLFALDGIARTISPDA